MRFAITAFVVIGAVKILLTEEYLSLIHISEPTRRS